MTEDRRDWQAHPSYTHNREVGAVEEVLDNPGRVLFVGDYATILATFMAEDYPTAHLITKQDATTPAGIDQHYTVSSYDSLPDLNPYDAVVVPCLDWPRRPDGLVRGLVDVVRSDGSIIIELSDETGEYVSILRTLHPNIAGDLFSERLRLLESFTTAGTVRRYQIRTAYHFQTIDDLILYFNQRSNKEQGRKLRQEEKEELRKRGRQIGFENVEEKRVLLHVTL